MPRPDDGLIHAWIDGELSPEESARVERLVAEDAEWGAAAAEARGLVAASSRILGALDSVPGGVIPAGSRAAPPALRRGGFIVRPWMRAAAGLVIIASSAALVVLHRSVAPESATVVQSPAEVMPPPPTISAARELTIGEAPRESTNAPRLGVAANAATNVATADVAIAAVPAPPPSPDRILAREPELDDRHALVMPQAPTALPPSVVTRAEAIAEAAAGVRARTRSAAAREEVAIQGFAAKAAVLTLEGCWRTATTAGADTLLVAPSFTRALGDTLLVASGATGRPARVVRDDARLTGTMADARGVSVAFSARAVACAQEPASPSPRR